MSNNNKLFGKYRGVVLNNIDPMQHGRLQVQVPDVAGLAPVTWAMPCVPVAGINMGMLALPIKGSGVWVEFEQGDPDYPIWVGCFWGSSTELPKLSQRVPPVVPGIILQTPGMSGIIISDVPGPTGGIQLQTAKGAMISVTDMGIMISNGQGAVINLTGSTVDINLGALTVV